MPSSLHGVPRVGSPASSVLQSTPTSCHPSRVASFPSLRATVARLKLRSHGRKAQHPRARGYLPDSPKPASSTEMTGSPRFLEDPTMNVPCSPTPAGPPRSATAALWCCLPPNGRRRLPRQILISGFNHTAHSLTVYASQSGLLHRHARLASGWLANLSGRGWLPAGSQRKVSDHLILLSQASPGAPKSKYQSGPDRIVKSSLARSVRIWVAP